MTLGAQLSTITGVSLSANGNFVFASGVADTTSYFAFWFLSKGVYQASCLFPLNPVFRFSTADFLNANSGERQE